MHELADGLPQPQRSLAFAGVAVVLFISVLDTSIANIALPQITRDLGIRPIDAIWIVNNYQLAVTVALLPLATLGDVLGYRRVYLAGIVVFTVASLLCALSGTLEIVIAARALQGLGAAAVMGLNIALIRFIYPHAMLGRAAGNTALIVGVSSAAGPSIAGIILTVAPWQALFLVNLPLGMMAVAIGIGTLPATARSGRQWHPIEGSPSRAVDRGRSFGDHLRYGYGGTVARSFWASRRPCGGGDYSQRDATVQGGATHSR